MPQSGQNLSPDSQKAPQLQRIFSGLVGAPQSGQNLASASSSAWHFLQRNFASPAAGDDPDRELTGGALGAGGAYLGAGGAGLDEAGFGAGGALGTGLASADLGAGATFGAGGTGFS